MRTLRNIITSLILSLLLVPQVIAQAYSSTEAHEEKVTTIMPFETALVSSSAFFTAGNDGFVIKWDTDGFGEHYQISDMQISLIARNPANNDIAVYETDGVSTHKVTVLDWKTYAKKYSKKYKDTVTSLSYSENGTYLIVGTAAVNGIYILNAKTGSVTKKISDISSVISMARTGASEQTAVFYASTGSLIYYDLKNFKVLTTSVNKKNADGTTTKQTVTQKFNTEPNLEQTMIFGNGNKFLAGVKNNTIYVINAMNGKTIARYQARSPFILSSKSQDEKGLYYITNEGKNYSLRIVENQTLEDIYKSSKSGNTTQTPDSLVVKNFVGLKSRDSFTCASKNAGMIFMGTQSGNIYTMSDVPESETYTLMPMTEQMYQQIYDIEAINNDFYFLTDNDIYKSSYQNQAVKRIGSVSNHTNLLKYEDDLILWSKGKKSTVELAKLENETVVSTEVLFTPQRELQNIRLYGSSLVYIQGNSEVGIFDINTGKNSLIYSGTSVQDAILYNNDVIYVAKASTGGNDTPLISININTRETVPVNIDGYVVYSLSSDFTETNNNLYGILMTSNNNGTNITELFQYNLKTSSFSSLLKLNDEDSTAFTSIQYPVVYTNLGKNQIYACNTSSKKNTIYRRSASIPIKLERTPNQILILNKDGSLSWYNTTSQAIQAEWHLTVDGDWFDTKK